MILDVDGVLSPPRILMTPSGQVIKEFSIYDGLGLQLLQNTGIEVAVISGRNSAAVKKRATEIGIKYVFQGVEDKLVPFKKLLTRLKIKASETAFIGDDLPDLPLLKRSGLSMTVPHANVSIRESVDYISKLPGGEGAVREVCELILIAQGNLQEQLARYKR